MRSYAIVSETGLGLAGLRLAAQASGDEIPLPDCDEMPRNSTRLTPGAELPSAPTAKASANPLLAGAV